MASKKNPKEINESGNSRHDGQELLLYLLAAVDKVDLIDPSDIPNIDLYMDQVTTFMDEHLKQSRRFEEDKILTKTMINNYAKNNLLPPPERKKYTREHIILLIFIYYYKGILTLQDIQSILEPIGRKYFHSKEGRSVSDLYDEVIRMDRDRHVDFREEVNDMVDNAADYFSDSSGDEREFLRVLSMINMLAYDIFVRKMLIEKLIDRYFTNGSPEQGKASRKKAKNPPSETE